MTLRYLDFQSLIFKKKNVSFLFKLPSVRDIWLFNCIEGSQFNFLNQTLKVNNLSKIIIPNLHTLSISGLLGLLSTLSLIGRVRTLHIYAPIDIKYYIDFGKKYSRTSFSYVLYIHTLKNGLLVNQYDCRIYALKLYQHYEFFILQSEKLGTFNLEKALCNGLKPGPMYRKMKQGLTFLSPDGLCINGNNFTYHNQLGFQLSYLNHCFYRKKLFKLFKKNDFTLFF
uniref:Ribonuclease Z n=1 Tax=Polysiphonia sertularioides TaxID=945028 RepID=A0A1Z1M8W4_9FLOR|nr:ribonuclease Z [Polysiphonia sertularioides]ARW62409.1 ribonuclease Z [Polysiphonia sertularioides]